MLCGQGYSCELLCPEHSLSRLDATPGPMQVARHFSDLSYVPSVFQVRLAGAKGVVMVQPDLQGDVIQLRPSMIKFAANATNNFLEVQV